MGDSYSSVWSDIVHLVTEVSNMCKIKLFCLLYALHVAMYSIWRERNRVKHGEKLTHIDVLKKLVDKGVRNKMSVIRSKGVKGMESSIQYGFVQEFEEMLELFYLKSFV